MNQLFTELRTGDNAYAARITLITRKSHVYTKAKVTTSKIMFCYEEDGIRQASKLAEESLGCSSLRPQQEKIVLTFVQGNDAMI